MQLRSILQDHRKVLIEKLITGGIETYVEYKFNIKINSAKVQELKLKLDELAGSGIDIDTYRPIFDAVEVNEFTALDNLIFYSEIDKVLNPNLFQAELFQGGKQVFFSDFKSE